MSNTTNKKAMLDEFLNPKSMLTPGIAGSLTMLFTNTLAAQFSLPPNYTGLLISFLFGLVVFAATVAAVWWLRLVLWLLNSLFIFSIALGTNQIGVQTAKPTSATTSVRPPPFALMIQPKKAFFANWLDGTVTRRERLLASVAQLDESKAKTALRVLGVETKEPGLAKNTLEGSAAAARTVDGIVQIEKAIATAERKPGS